MGTKKKDGAPKISQASLKEALGDAEHFRFRCTGCGKCCEGPGEVYFTKEDMVNIFNFLGLKKDEQRTLLGKTIVQSIQNGYLVHSAGNACYFLDENKRCKIYPVRPLQCRSFPFWPSTFASKEALDEVSSECPGTMGPPARTDSFSIVQTQRRVNQTSREFFEGQEDPEAAFMI